MFYFLSDAAVRWWGSCSPEEQTSMPLTSGTVVQSTGLPIWVRNEKEGFLHYFYSFWSHSLRETLKFFHIRANWETRSKMWHCKHWNHVMPFYGIFSVSPYHVATWLVAAITVGEYWLMRRPKYSLVLSMKKITNLNSYSNQFAKLYLARATTHFVSNL